MKKIILFTMILSMNISYSQKNSRIIYATTTKNVNVFFQSPITTAIVGSQSYSFGFNKEEKSTYGLLKAMPGLESNLLITTDNGNIFSFIIRYKKDIEELNYFISDSTAIGNTKGKTEVLEQIQKEEKTDTPFQEGQISDNVSKAVTINDFEKSPGDVTRYSKKTDDYYSADRIGYYEEYSKKEIERERFYKRFYSSSNRIFLRVKNIAYNRDELYFTLIVDNQSSLDYDIEDLSFFITARNKAKKTSTQRIGYVPEHIHQKIERVGAFSEKEVVYVFKKFSINSEKVLIVSLSEFKGERNINLEIQNTIVNNPN